MIKPPNRLARISIEPGSDPNNSLEKCLKAILVAFDRNDQSAVMAHLPGAIANDMEKYLEMADRAIRSVGKEYSLEVRELHPPQAAPIPVTPPEFDLHWHDSYLPFVREALDRDEPILAYGSWPQPAGDWGVITTIDNQGRCSGHTCIGLCEMIGPALLAYVFGSKI